VEALAPVVGFPQVWKACLTAGAYSSAVHRKLKHWRRSWNGRVLAHIILQGHWEDRKGRLTCRWVCEPHRDSISGDPVRTTWAARHCLAHPAISCWCCPKTVEERVSRTRLQAQAKTVFMVKTDVAAANEWTGDDDGLMTMDPDDRSC
jgi:hypothetical protein